MGLPPKKIIKFCKKLLIFPHFETIFTGNCYFYHKMTIIDNF